jgi:glucokinase
MAVIGVDVGGTKLALASFSEDGEIQARDVVAVEGRQGGAVGELIVERIQALRDSAMGDPITAVGVAVPGIYYAERGRVWAPNIPGWDDYPLGDELGASLGDGVRVSVDSDRAAYVLGDVWRGTAQGSRNAVFIAVGTGIGAGVLVDGRVLRGQRDIAGAIGWLALDRSYLPGYETHGGFEYPASGPGLIRHARDLLRDSPGYAGALTAERLTTADLFAAYDAGDPLAARVLDNAVELWGMAAANLISIFDPEVVVFGGGVFGPAARFLERIRAVALRWGQPISTPQVRFGVCSLGGDAGLYGAGHLALRSLSTPAARLG